MQLGLIGKKPSSLALFATVGVLGGCGEDVLLIQNGVVYVAATTDTTTAVAGFYDDARGASDCSSQVIDRCRVTTCLDGGSVRHYVDGGEVRFRGEELETTLDTGSVTDDEGESGPGLAQAADLPALQSGETVTISVLGKGSISRVESDVTLPERLELSEPVIEEPSCQSVDPDELPAVTADATDDFVVRWSSNEESNVDILFYFDDILDWPEDNDRERFTSVQCLHTADEEQAIIPEEVLELMPVGVRGAFSLRQITSHARIIGDWSITFGGYWELCSPLIVE